MVAQPIPEIKAESLSQPLDKYDFNIPENIATTFATILTIHGIELDTFEVTMRLPQDKLTKRLIFTSLSYNFKQAYSTALKKIFREFLKQYHIRENWPIPTDVIFNFIDYLSLQTLSANTIQLYVRALSYYHRLKSLPG